MAHPSQKARKARSRNKTSLQGKLREANEKNARLGGLAIAAHDQSAYLAKLLTFIVANYGEKGVLKVDDTKLASMPDGAQLQELYEKESNSIVLTAIVRVREDAPDKGCVTAPDGSCASTEGCMHGAPEPLIITDEQSEIDPAALDPRNLIKVVG